jgi:Copper type II ascorbate-dependent monooxygenase, C-terminal domain
MRFRQPKRSTCPFAIDPALRESKRAYPSTVNADSGDALSTTCTYDDTTNTRVTFRPSEQMCYTFVTTWPAGG